jgi:Cu(I)/Ag(I) efflux system membrane fusion protein
MKRCSFIYPIIIAAIAGLCSCGPEAKGPRPADSAAHEQAHRQEISQPGLGSLVRPANEFVISSIPMVTMEKREEQIETEALGQVAYDTRQAGSISSRVAGRIVKLYVRYRYQKVTKGQRILDLYSPELVTAQQNLLFLLRNDPGNSGFIASAREKLMLLGMGKSQLDEVVRTGKPAMTVPVYSHYSGHIHESVNPASMQAGPGDMRDLSLLTEELSLKEGMYLQRGQSVFSVFDPSRAWVLLHIPAESQGLVRTGNAVRIVPETAPDKDFRATIGFIEPFYRKDSKTMTARVYFGNHALRIPIGSQVRATIFGNTKEASWLPLGSVLSLGMDRVVFLRSGEGFRSHRIVTGMTHGQYIQVLEGLDATDSVAANAQFLVDSESFIKVKKP